MNLKVLPWSSDPTVRKVLNPPDNVCLMRPICDKECDRTCDNPCECEGTSLTYGGKCFADDDNICQGDQVKKFYV